MKVLIITASIDKKSGWGRHALAITEHLRLHGAEVNLYVEKHGVMAFLRNSICARRAARGHDVVHAMDGWPLGIWGYFAVAGRSTTLFINGVGTYSIAPLYSAWKKPLLLMALRRAKRIFCISEYTRFAMEHAGAPSLALMVVHFGVPMFPISSRDYQEMCRRKYNITTDRFPIVLTVGAIKDRKGQLDTLKAVILLQKRYPRILYIAAGSSNHKWYIEEMRDYAVRSTGDILRIIERANDEVLACLYSICNIFVLNSTNDDMRHHFEGFGATILEAAQFGKPAVGSRDCGIEDAIADGKSGLLSAQRNPEDIARKIVEILERLDFFSHNASMRHSLFNWHKTATAYMESYLS